jgi:hypothetical protein
MSDAPPAEALTQPIARRILRFVAPLPAYFGLSAYLYEQRTAIAFGPASRLVGAVTLAALFLLCLAAAPGTDASGEVRTAWRATLRRLSLGGVPLLPLAFLPLARHSAAWATGLSVVALLAYALTHGRGLFESGSDERGNLLGPFEMSLIGFCLLVLIIYVQIGAQAEGNFQNDSAYYFGVAKFMARTAKFEEPIVWHFLRKPAKVPTLPFDYWGGLTSVFLAPFLAIFGRTQHVANTVMAAISGFSVALFGYLVAVERLVKNRVVAVALLVGFALAPELAGYRFDTETVPLYQFLILLTLLLAMRGRWASASLAAGLLYHVRPDAAFATLLVWAWAIAHARRSGGLGRVLSVQAGLVAVTLGYGLLAFGRPFGVRGIAVRLPIQIFLYRWGAIHQVNLIASRLGEGYVATRMGIVVRTLADVVPGGAVLLTLIATAGVATLWEARRDGVVRTLVWCLGLPCAMAIGIASGPMYAPWRTLHPVIPLVMLSGGCALDSLMRVVWRQRASTWLKRLGATGLASAVGVTVVWHLSLYGYRAGAAIEPAMQELRKLNGALHGEVVASNVPWYVIANTDSPSVSIPIDGPKAVQEVLKKYHARWIVLAGNTRNPHSSLSKLLGRRSRSSFGEFLFEKEFSKRGLELIRVVDRGR